MPGSAAQVRVLLLQRDRRRPAVSRAQLPDPLQPPGAHVGPADVAGLAGGDDAGQRLQRLLQRRGPVVDVHVVQVDVVGAEPPQAVVDRVAQVSAPAPANGPPGERPSRRCRRRPTGRAGTTACRCPWWPGRPRRAVAAVAQPPAQQLLALAAEAAAAAPTRRSSRRCRGTSRRRRRSGRGSVRSLLVGRVTHDHAAQGQLADMLAGAAEFHCLHGGDARTRSALQVKLRPHQ